jgi:hypothetical protein
MAVGRWMQLGWAPCQAICDAAVVEVWFPYQVLLLPQLDARENGG